MREFEVYSPEDIIAANLAESAARQAKLYEQEYAHLRELAVEMVSDEDLHEWIASLPDHRLAPAEGNGLDGAIQKKERTRRCVILALEIARLYEKSHMLSPAAFFPDAEPIPPSAQGHILYQRNSYTDEAFLRFSALLGRPAAAYTHSYPASCEAVFNQEAEYCILPIENSSEGHLVGFARLLEQYDLKIAATCDISGNGAAHSTRFALVRRNLLPIITHAGSKTMLDLRLDRIAPSEIGEHFMAADLCGLKLHRMDTLPDPVNAKEIQLYLSFFTDGAHLLPFLFYLAMEAPSLAHIGLYPHITH